MSFSSWLRNCKHGTALRTPLRTRWARPQLELLEDRLAPAAVVTVNSILDTNSRDSLLTLREAIMVANGTLTVATLSAAEQAQVIGAPSTVDADTINFNIPGAGVPRRARFYHGPPLR